MAFIKKTWFNRISQYPNRRTLTKTDGSIETVTVARDEGEITQEGTQLNAENLNDLEQRIADANAQILGDFATVETGSTASKAYAVGDYIVKDGYFYRVTASIAQGDTFTVDGNIVKTNVGAEVTSLNNDLSNVVSQIKSLSFSQQLSGRETRQLDLPSNIFAYNLIFGNAQGLCDNYTHFGAGIGARNIFLRNSANNVQAYFYIGATEMITDTAATGIQLQVQVLYFEK